MHVIYIDIYVVYIFTYSTIRATSYFKHSLSIEYYICRHIWVWEIDWKHCVFIMPFMSSTLCGRGVHSPMVEGKFLRKKDHEFPTFFFSAPNGSGVRISRHWIRWAFKHQPTQGWSLASLSRMISSTSYNAYDACAAALWHLQSLFQMCCARNIFRVGFFWQKFDVNYEFSVYPVWWDMLVPCPAK